MAVILVAGGAAMATPAGPAYADQGGTAVLANIVWRVSVGSRPDYMSTANPTERNAFPLDGQTYYVPQGNISGTAPLYRLYNPNFGGSADHMDSRTAGEGGFQTESPTGYVFTTPSAGNGLTQYLRTYDSCTYDHGNRSPYEAQKSCYHDEPISGAYAWARFGQSAWNPLTLSAGGVTIDSNLAAGGALSHWTYNGVQYINNYDDGRQVQTSMFFARSGVNGPNTTANPTEAGDTYSQSTMNPALRHGSPLASASNTSATTQSTRAVPLDFAPTNFSGGPDHPIVYKDMLIGKDITLNWGGQGPVARYTTVVTSPALGDPGIEIPTAYLKSSFNRFFTYDATSGALHEVTGTFGSCSDTSYYTYTPPNRGGVIIANADLSQAMGVYGANTSVGGSVTEMRLYSFVGGGCGTGTGEYDVATSKFTVLHEGPIPSGTTTFNSYLMTGSVPAVEGYMNQLRAWGNS